MSRAGRSLLYIGAPDDYSTAVTRAEWAKDYIFQNNPVQKAPAIEAAQQAEGEKLGIWGAQCAPPPAPTTTRQAPQPTQDDNANVRRPAPPAPRPAPEPEPE